MRTLDLRNVKNGGWCQDNVPPERMLKFYIIRSHPMVKVKKKLDADKAAEKMAAIVDETVRGIVTLET